MEGPASWSGWRASTSARRNGNGAAIASRVSCSDDVESGRRLRPSRPCRALAAFGRHLASPQGMRAGHAARSARDASRAGLRGTVDGTGKSPALRLGGHGPGGVPTKREVSPARRAGAARRSTGAVPFGSEESSGRFARGPHAVRTAPELVHFVRGVGLTIADSALQLGVPDPAPRSWRPSVVNAPPLRENQVSQLPAADAPTARRRDTLRVAGKESVWHRGLKSILRTCVEPASFSPAGPRSFPGAHRRAGLARPPPSFSRRTGRVP